eukprot:TRINITY_DN21180_c0_g1_i1.p1 TRINITY_DN21180_c0_g1~~TRINITY_DN21180_c0_g1_i1.p1  ORF type:complete len:1503 (+),score=344.46 TRINITY_DN21180_c0_g1_i1:167-4675(+)
MSSPDDARPENCGQVGWYSYFTYAWVNSVVSAGVQRQVQTGDIPELARKDDVLVNTHRLLAELEKAERQRKSHPLLRAVCHAFKYEIGGLQLLKIVAHLLGLLSPLLLKELLVFQEEQGKGGKPLTDEQIRRGFAAVFGLILLGLFMIFYGSQMAFCQERLSLRIQSALRGVVLLRCVRGTTTTRSDRPVDEEEEESDNSGAPAVYNVISFDIGPNIDIIWIVLGLWFFPFQFFTTLTVLYTQIAAAAIPGVVTILVAKTVCLFLLSYDGILRHELLKAKDVRLSRCDEGFNNIRTLQMLNWVEPHHRQILEARQEELRITNRRLYLTKSVFALDYSLGVIVTLVMLSYYVSQEGAALKASVVLPVIALVNGLAGPFGQIPVWAGQYLVWKSAYRRVNTYIGLDPQGSAGSAGHDVDAAGGGSPRRQDTVASFGSCTLCWATSTGDRPLAIEGGGPAAEDALTSAAEPLLRPEPFKLKELELDVRSGELLVVVGKDGQGKTSVLQALLGEMSIQSGTIVSPAVQRRAEEDKQGALAAHAVPSNVSEAREALRQRDNDGSQSLQMPLQSDQGAALDIESGSPGGYSPLSEETTQEEADTVPVPFASQMATLFTGTIRWNILFGAPYEAGLYQDVLRACALEVDLGRMPAGDMTDVAQGGATLSGGQRQRIGLARATYRAALQLRRTSTRRAEGVAKPPLVLLDDPFSALDAQVARDVCGALFKEDGGLLSGCAVIVATANPWWLTCLPRRSQAPAGRAGTAAAGAVCLAVLREGRVVASGPQSSILDLNLTELATLKTEAAQSEEPGRLNSRPMSNPQDDEVADDAEETPQENALDNRAQIPGDSNSSPPVAPLKVSEGCTQTDLTGKQKEDLSVVKEEKREEGHVNWHTYEAYFSAVGYWTLSILAIALSGIMIFQNLCSLLIVYWTSEHRQQTLIWRWSLAFTETPPEQPNDILVVYACFVLGFTLSNFAGHYLEIIGGMSAARLIFFEAIGGTLPRPWRWWDANPTGRVLNRFSEDVQVMDEAITNIMGVIFGAVLYFVGHSFILALSNPISLALLPFIAMGLEYYARFYRTTIREVQRHYLVCMGAVYQDMVEAIVGKVTVNAFDSVRPIFCHCMSGLDSFQRMGFLKVSLNLWLGLRMSLVGYTLGIFAKMYPIFQFYGYLAPQSAALVGFSITYSTETVAIIQQFIVNYSSLEMQLISIERLREYARSEQAGRTQKAALTDEASRGGGGASLSLAAASAGGGHRGLKIVNVCVTYRQGLPPALSDVSLEFAPSEVAAIVGRTGAGKSSLLLSILQLVPYDGAIVIDGVELGSMTPESVRKTWVSVVPQQPVMFAGSVRWNLDPHNEFSDDRLWQALESVGLRALCSANRHGLQAVISTGRAGSAPTTADAASEDSAAASRRSQPMEPLTLSQGQQQLLCAARALLRRPRVALLDEVTSSLQPETADATAAQLIGQFKENKATVLLVTHQERLLSICDRSVHIAAGRVVSQRQQRAAA